MYCPIVLLVLTQYIYWQISRINAYSKSTLVRHIIRRVLAAQSHYAVNVSLRKDSSQTQRNASYQYQTAKHTTNNYPLISHLFVQHATQATWFPRTALSAINRSQNAYNTVSLLILALDASLHIFWGLATWRVCHTAHCISKLRMPVWIVQQSMQDLLSQMGWVMCTKMWKDVSNIIRLMGTVYSVCQGIVLRGIQLFALVHCQIIEDSIIGRMVYSLLFHIILLLVTQIGH